MANEPGSSAGNSVFVDLSTDKQFSAARNSWDLGFYCGPEFRVIINNTTSATIKALTTRTNLQDVVASDTIGLSLGFSFTPTDYALVDDIRGVLSKTAMPAITANEADNKVYILNCGTGGSVAARDWYKIKITRNGSYGYTLQYAKLKEGSTISSINIIKDENYNFRYLHLQNGLVEVEPYKELWDFKWSYQLYETSLGGSTIPYPFSDLVMINHLAGVHAAQVLTSVVSFDNYKQDNIGSTVFSPAMDVIGSSWRSTQPATGARTDRFYVIKDPAGRVYKLKFLAMGAGDGGVRGKPQFQYQLVK